MDERNERSNLLPPLRQAISSIFSSLLNLSSKWKEIVDEGLLVMNSLMNGIVEQQFLKNPHNWGVFVEDIQFQELAKNKHKMTIGANFSKLQKTIIALKNYLQEMEKLSEEIQEIHEDVSQSTEGFASSTPIFRTITLERFMFLVMNYVEMYQKEMKVKETILTDLFNEDRDLQLTYLSTWQLQPFINKSFIQEIENILEVEMKST